MGDELAAASHGLPTRTGSEPSREEKRLAALFVSRYARDWTDLKHLLQALGLIPDDGSAP